MPRYALSNTGWKSILEQIKYQNYRRILLHQITDICKEDTPSVSVNYLLEVYYVVNEKRGY